MKYLVEFMAGEAVASSQQVDASTPLMAASKAARGSMVHFSIDRADWIRVTPPGKPSFEFGHTQAVTTAQKPVRKAPGAKATKASASKAAKPKEPESVEAAAEPEVSTTSLEDLTATEGAEAVNRALDRLWKFDQR